MQTTEPAKSIDKRQVAQSLHALMESLGLDWEEVATLARTPPPVVNGIPPIWNKVSGMLRDDPIDPLAYQNAVRDEWDR